jgi:hypothetical protein
MVTFFFNADDLFLKHDLAKIELEGFPSEDIGLPVQLRLQPVKSDSTEKSYQVHIEQGRWRHKDQPKSPNQIYFVRQWKIDFYNGCVSKYEDCNEKNPCLNCRGMAANEDLNQDCSNEEYYEQYKNDVMSVLSRIIPNVKKKFVIDCRHYETKLEELTFY